MWTYAYAHLALVFTILSWMTSLVPERITCAWRARFPELADAIAYAAEQSESGTTLTRAADLTAVAFYESSFNPDAIGDMGQSFGAFQIHPPYRSGVTKESLLDPRTAAVVSERLLSKSERVCLQAGSPAPERWSWYASGDPACIRGRDKARLRYDLARTLERRATLETR